MKLIITLEITDEETVEFYKDCADEITLQDLSYGSLIEKCGIVKVEVVS